MSWFKFKGVSSQNYGILERLPLDLRAEKVTTVIDIPNGLPVIYESKGYRSQVTTLTLGLKDNSAANLAEINKWLTGKGELIFSDDPDKHYVAVCNGALTGTRMVRNLGQLPIQFTVLPFKYLNNGSEWQNVTLTAKPSGDGFNASISNPGSVESEPVFKIYGSGTIGLFDWFSRASVKVRNVSEYCIIDVPNRRVFDKNGNVILNETTGNVPDLRIASGSGAYMFDSTVTKVEVKVNPRWL